MNKRIAKKHKDYADYIYTCVQSGKDTKQFTYNRSIFLISIMRKYYGIKYYHEKDDKKTEKFCF